MAQDRDQYEVGIQQVLRMLDDSRDDAKELMEQIIDACDRVVAHNADLLVAYYLDAQRASTRRDHERSEMQRALRMKQAVQKWSSQRSADRIKKLGEL